MSIIFRIDFHSRQQCAIEDCRRHTRAVYDPDTDEAMGVCPEHDKLVRDLLTLEQDVEVVTYREAA